MHTLPLTQPLPRWNQKCTQLPRLNAEGRLGSRLAAGAPRGCGLEAAGKVSVDRGLRPWATPRRARLFCEEG